MTRPARTDLESGTEGWDAVANDNIDVDEGPLPLKVITGIANLPAASSNDQCIVIVNEGGTYIQMFSDSVLWRSIGGELPYGSIYVDAGASGQALSGGTDTKINQFAADGIARNITMDHTNDKLIIPAIFKGRYQVGFSISFDGAVSSSYEISMRVGGSRNASLVAEETTGDASAEGCVSVSGFIDVSAATDLEVYVVESVGTTFTVLHANLWAKCLEIEK